MGVLNEETDGFGGVLESDNFDTFGAYFEQASRCIILQLTVKFQFLDSYL